MYTFYFLCDEYLRKDREYLYCVHYIICSVISFAVIDFYLQYMKINTEQALRIAKSALGKVYTL